MRDIQKYTSDYDCMDDPANRFETEYQVVYRRKKSVGGTKTLST